MKIHRINSTGTLGMTVPVMTLMRCGLKNGSIVDIRVIDADRFEVVVVKR